MNKTTFFRGEGTLPIDPLWPRPIGPTIHGHRVLALRTPYATYVPGLFSRALCLLSIGPCNLIFVVPFNACIFFTPPSLLLEPILFQIHKEFASLDVGTLPGTNEAFSPKIPRIPNPPH